MKCNKWFILLPLLLCSCTPNESTTGIESTPDSSNSSENTSNTSETVSPEDLAKAKAAINSLKGISHTAVMVQTVYVNQLDTDLFKTQDFYSQTTKTTKYSYEERDLTAISQSSVMAAANLEEHTHDIVTDENGNELIGYYYQHETLYFKDEETGCVTTETIDLKNNIEISIMADMSDMTTYEPIIFEEEFINPFDFIQPRDLTYTGEVGSRHTFSLKVSQAEFIADCYQANAINKIESCQILTDEDYTIQRVEFTIPDEGDYNEDGYTRTSELIISYSDLGQASKVSHLTKYTNDNPELDQAFHAILNSDNYKYEKHYYDRPLDDENTQLVDNIVGYLTKDKAFYHHHDSPTDTHPYEAGDDNDYAAIKQEDGTYLGYEYTYGSDSYSWGAITVSSSAYYIIDDYQGLGPNLNGVDTAIFKLKEGTNNVYTVDDVFLPSIGSIFDFQFLGVNSQLLETNTSSFELILEEDGSFKVNTGFRYYDNNIETNFYIQYIFSADTINNTSLPSYFTL